MNNLGYNVRLFYHHFFRQFKTNSTRYHLSKHGLLEFAQVIIECVATNQCNTYFILKPIKNGCFIGTRNMQDFLYATNNSKFIENVFGTWTTYKSNIDSAHGTKVQK